jgi:hypothetical protein
VDVDIYICGKWGKFRRRKSSIPEAVADVSNVPVNPPSNKASRV